MTTYLPASPLGDVPWRPSAPTVTQTPPQGMTYFNGDLLYDPAVGMGKTSAVFLDYLSLLTEESLSEEEQMRRALLYFVPDITDAQIQDAITCGFTPAESARFVAVGWPDADALDLLRALRDTPRPRRSAPNTSGLHLYFGDQW